MPALARLLLAFPLLVNLPAYSTLSAEQTSMPYVLLDTLLVVLLQAILGTANVLTLSLVIGLTSWASIAKVVRTEVRRLRSSEYVLASRCMGGGFIHVLRQHLAPNFF